MAGSSTNFGLIKPLTTEAYDVQVTSDNADKIDVALTDATSFPTATGTGTAILVSKPSVLAMRVGMNLTFIASASNSGAATTLRINALAIANVYKPGTTDAPNIVAGKAYTVWYNGTNFFLQASAEGTAAAAQVLAGYTFSSDAGTGLNGSMVNNGALGTYTPTTTNQSIPAGYTTGGTVAGDTDLTAANIKQGVQIFGINGTFTSDSNAVAGEILSGKTAYVNGVKITGTIASKGVQTYTPGTTDQTITAGQYLSGDQTIAGDADLISANIKSGITIFGVAGNSNVVDTSTGDAIAANILSGKIAWVDGVSVTGTMANNGALGTYTPTTSNQSIPAGYTSGGTVAGDADLIAANIKSGVVIFGVTGTNEGGGITFQYGLPPL